MAVELRIPVVVLDNAYSPSLAQLFAAVHGPMADGLVLTGPSSFHAPDAPDWLCQVPPYIDYSETAAQGVLESIGLPDRLLITVLGYELKAERLAAGLLTRLVDLDCHAVFITPDPEQCRLRLDTLSPAIRDRVRAIAPPSDPVLFGLLARARLAIGKCGFMQVSECLALRTPVIGVTYRGCFPLDLLSPAARRFVCAVTEPVASDDVARTARQLLMTDPETLATVHDGQFGASERVADFLERLPREPRAGTTEQCADQGYPTSILQKALGREWPGEPIAVTRARCSRLRNLAGGRIDAIACEFMLGSRRRFAVLWGRCYASAADAAADFADAAREGSKRTILFASQEDRLLIERNAGEQMLPALE